MGWGNASLFGSHPLLGTGSRNFPEVTRKECFLKVFICSVHPTIHPFTSTTCILITIKFKTLPRGSAATLLPFKTRCPVCNEEAKYLKEKTTTKFNKRISCQVQGNHSFSLRFPTKFTSKSLLESSLFSPTSAHPPSSIRPGDLTSQTSLRAPLPSRPCARPPQSPSQPSAAPRHLPAAGVAPSGFRPPGHSPFVISRALKRR